MQPSIACACASWSTLIAAGRQIARGDIGRGGGGESIVGVARIARGRYPAIGRGILRITIIAVRKHADGDAGAGERVGRAYCIAVLHEIALRGHRTRLLRARHGSADGVNFERMAVAASSCCTGIHPLTSFANTAACSSPRLRQGGLRLLRIASSDGIDEHLWLRTGRRSAGSARSGRDASADLR